MIRAGCGQEVFCSAAFLCLSAVRPAVRPAASKTVTVTLLACAVLAIVNGHEDVELGHRRVKMENVMKGICVILLQVFFLVISTFALCCIESDIPFIQIMYETFSALSQWG